MIWLPKMVMNHSGGRKSAMAPSRTLRSLFFISARGRSLMRTKTGNSTLPLSCS